MKVDIKQQLKTAIDTGKITMGSNKTIDSLLLDDPKLVLLASNCPRQQREAIAYYCRLSNTPCVTLKETSIEIGSSCGRPHPVSALSVIDEGESTILEVQE